MTSHLGLRRRAAFTATLGALWLSACGGGGDNAAQTQRPGGSIETRSGTYRGVGLGDDVAAMHRTFGRRRPAAEDERIVARSLEEGENDYSPIVIQLPPLDRVSPPYRAYLYEHVVFLARGRRIGSVSVNADGARLDRGDVRIGGELETAKERYGLRCGTVHEDSEYEEFPACTGKIAARRYIWFGGDPIRNVTIAVVPLGGL